jgi:ribosomal protein L23
MQRLFSQTNSLLSRITTTAVHNHQHRCFSSTVIQLGKTDGNNPNPLPKPYEIARRQKIALAKKQGIDVKAEVDAQRPVVQFPNRFISLSVPSVLKPTKQVVFYVPMEMTKPEVKDLLTNYYDLPVEKVNTAILRTRAVPMKRTRGGKVFPAAPATYYKKAIVFLSEEVDLGLDENIKREIESFYDGRLMKKYKAEAKKEQMKDVQQKQEDLMKQQEEQEKANAPQQIEA